jgi:sugar phosphate isomerase/epimerase
MTKTSNNYFLKGRFPFRLGATSAIIPDDVLPNVEFLKDKVDDIELVIFESDEISPIPAPSVIKRLKEIAEENGISYTVHLPFDVWLGHRDESVRLSSVGKCSRIFQRTSILEPFSYVLHIQADEGMVESSQGLTQWKDQLHKSLKSLVKLVPPHLIAMENLHYPYSLIEDLVRDYGLAACIDTGHLFRYGFDLDEHLVKYSQNTRVFHVHGEIEEKDHKDITHLRRQILEKLLKIASEKGQECVFTLEVFNKSDFLKSIKLLEDYLP